MTEIDGLMSKTSQLSSSTSTNKNNNYEEYEIDNKEAHYLEEDFKFKKPYAFVLNEEGKRVDNWRQMLQETCNILIDINSNKFKVFVKDDDLKVEKEII